MKTRNAQQNGTQPAAEVVSDYLRQLRSATADTEIARDKLKGLLNSSGRHGDLMVAHGALERAKAAIHELIELEEVR